MARDKVFQVSSLNIRVHSKHSPEEYARFWRYLHAMKAMSVHGHEALMIGDIASSRENEKAGYIYGEFYKFLNINPSDPWFDVNKKKPASDEDRDDISIPEHLKPNFSGCPYVFDLNDHKLYFISKISGKGSVGVTRIKRLIDFLVVSLGVKEEFKEVNVSIVTDKKKIDDMLSWPVIKCLEMYLERPNDDEDGDERDFLNRLNRIRAGSERRIYRKASGEKSLVADEEIKTFAHVASDNGVVKVTGKNRKGLNDSASSESFPKKEPVVVSDSQSLVDVFRQFVFRKRKPW